MIGKMIPPTEPAIPPIPTTELTALFGNKSEAVVNMVALQAWWAEAARLIRTTAIHIFVAYLAVITGNTAKAKINIAVFLALGTDHPLFIKYVDKYPPPILPRDV